MKGKWQLGTESQKYPDSEGGDDLNSASNQNAESISATQAGSKGIFFHADLPSHVEAIKICLGRTSDNLPPLPPGTFQDSHLLGGISEEVSEEIELQETQPHRGSLFDPDRGPRPMDATRFKTVKVDSAGSHTGSKGKGKDGPSYQPLCPPVPTWTAELPFRGQTTDHSDGSTDTPPGQQGPPPNGTFLNPTPGSQDREPPRDRMPGNENANGNGPEEQNGNSSNTKNSTACPGLQALMGGFWQCLKSCGMSCGECICVTCEECNKAYNRQCVLPFEGRDRNWY
ncbi:hypothetical protein NW762_007380 [Fusarium torreyae]|uniref:Uncharacterized protein n=1 Tax=Fusarium torreyae TaxID=1237075 RepID=A0A9W8VE03_9HYPO|nr:hypothetical protein NW762_007380 [Fusarium torreyae]